MQGAELLSVELLIQSVTRLDIEYPAFDEAHNRNMYGDLNFFFFFPLRPFSSVRARRCEL